MEELIPYQLRHFVPRLRPSNISARWLIFKISGVCGVLSYYTCTSIYQEQRRLQRSDRSERDVTQTHANGAMCEDLSSHITTWTGLRMDEIQEITESVGRIGI